MWKRHKDQLLRFPADVASTHSFLASEYQHSMPLDVPHGMDQPRQIVRDPGILSPYIPPTATLDESIMTGTEEDSPIAQKQPTVSIPIACH